jgi:hypothetical protein
MTPQCRFSRELDIATSKATILDIQLPSGKDTIDRNSDEQVGRSQDGMYDRDALGKVDQLYRQHQSHSPYKYCQLTRGNAAEGSW